MGDKFRMAQEQAGHSDDSDGEGQSDLSGEEVGDKSYSQTPASDSVDAAVSSLADRLRHPDALRIRSDSDQLHPAVLESLDVEGIVAYIKEGRAKNIVTMAGAGISTTAGIPDFRTPGTGLYDNLQKYDLPDPTAIFDIRFFRSNPAPFFMLARELYPGKFTPTVSHYFVSLLQEKGLLLRHYTQNIDTLEREAGLKDQKLVEAHGAFHKGHCIDCHKEYSESWLRERIMVEEQDMKEVVVPLCSCGGVVKPDIVFFGENLPERFHRLTGPDFEACDLLIILGTSLVVHPFASLVNLVGPNCPRLLINRETVGVGGPGCGGLQLGQSSNYRDASLLGCCDSGCRLIAESLGWGEDLQRLVTAGRERGSSGGKETAKEDLEGLVIAGRDGGSSAGQETSKEELAIAGREKEGNQSKEEKDVEGVTLVVRVIRSFPHRNIRNLVLHGVRLDDTTKQLLEQAIAAVQASKALPPPFRKFSYDTLKIEHKAHGAKTSDPVINTERDGQLILRPNASLAEQGVGHETELSLFLLSDYLEYKEGPDHGQVQW